MKKYYLNLIVLSFNTFFMTLLPHTSSKILCHKKAVNSCPLPGINPLLLFPFGQKSDAIKIQCIQQGHSLIEILSLKLPIDRDDVGRAILPAIMLGDLLDDATLKTLAQMTGPYLKIAEIKEFTIIPHILFLKNKVNTLIGIELCFPKKEEQFLKIARIALFFVQNISKEDADEQYIQPVGFNRLAVYNTPIIEQNMLIFGETDEYKKEIHLLIESLFKKLAATYTSALSSTFLTIIKAEVDALTMSAIGLIIEESDRIPHTLAQLHASENITSTLLADKEYLIYNHTNEKALVLVDLIKKHSMPLTSNYYLYGSIMGYDEEHITFKYQLEAYLKSMGNINSDGTIRWPYNIPKWLKKNNDAFDAWIQTYWNAHAYFLYPKKRRRYEHDKKKAQKYLK